MYFDFFNYTFSSVISLVTAVFGMSYPLLIESIQKINDRYQSYDIKTKFEESVRFKGYNIVLVLSVLIAVIMPFLLMAAYSCKGISYALITIQVVLLFILVFFTLQLVDQIRLYNEPRKLMDLLIAEDNIANMNSVLDLTKYVSRSDYDLYRKGMAWMLGEFMKYNKAYGGI